MKREEIEASVHENLDAWNRQDAAGTVEMIAPDCLYIDNNTEVRGRDEIRANTEAYFDAFPDLHLEIDRTHIDGDTIVQEWRSSGTHKGDLMGIPPTNRRTEVRGVAINEFGSDGLVHRSVLCWDTAKLLRDLGVLPTPTDASTTTP